MKVKPPLVHLEWTQYRLVASRFPGEDLFAAIADSKDYELLHAIESLTNPRLDTRYIPSLVRPEDILTGPGSSPVMASFLHVSTSNPSRFSDGRFGVYYCAHQLETAIHETIYHRQRFLANTAEAPGVIDMRCYKGKLEKPVHDIRNPNNKTYSSLHHPWDYSTSQAFGRIMRDRNSWGIAYRSVRSAGGECIAALRPPAVSKPIQSAHYAYVWDGKQITHYYKKSHMRKLRA